MEVELGGLHLTEHLVASVGLRVEEREEEEEKADHDQVEAALSSGSWYGLRLCSGRPPPSRDESGAHSVLWGLPSSLHPHPHNYQTS